MIVKMLTGQKMDVLVKDRQEVHADLIFELVQVVDALDPDVIGDFAAYGRTGASVCIWIAGSSSEAEVTGLYRNSIKRYKKQVS